jgi:uncharacterized protein
MSRYRILTLDGGGAWALIEVMALIDLYGADTTGHEVLRDFDMVAANSGGGIVLGGLVEDLSLQTMLDFFLSQDKRQSIFVRKSLHLPGMEKYITAGKLTGLRAAFPKRCDVPLNEVAQDIPGHSGKAVHLLIAGFNYDRNRGEFFRSADATRPGWGIGAPSTATLAECIHASSNAPIRYFDRPAELPTQPGSHYWDGAISGSNNPILIAVTEALVLGQPAQGLAALSIGTGGTFLPMAPENADPSEPYYLTIHESSLTTDLEKIAGAILDDPPDVASFMAHVMSGGPPVAAVAPVDSSIVRLNPMIAPVLNEESEFVLPHGMDADSFENLVKLDMDAVEQDQVDEIVNFARLWLKGSISNQPVRAAADLTPEIGQGKYAQGKLAWSQLIQMP